MANLVFQKAVKRDAKGRIALIGPAGSGKSYTMLRWATALAAGKGRIAAVDTEHGSLSKYADLFDFDVINLDSYSPDNFMDALNASRGHAVFCCDSLSHFWMGKDGALEFVDNAKKRSQSRDDMSGWKEFRPHERGMVDAMIASPCHVIVTMRTKTAYEEHVNERGKKQRVKIGLAPVQRDGLEYEFDFVGAMDEDNNLIVDKTRCPFYTGKAISKPTDKDFAPFIEWLKGAPTQPPAAPKAAPKSQSSTNSGGNPQKGVSETPEATTAAGGGPGNGKKPAAELPEALKVLLAQADNVVSAHKVIQGMKKDIVELTGSDYGYYEVVRGKHEVEHVSVQVIKEKGGKWAHKVICQLFEYLSKCAQSVEADPEPAADDKADWVPVELGGAVTPEVVA